MTGWNNWLAYTFTWMIAGAAASAIIAAVLLLQRRVPRVERDGLARAKLVGAWTVLDESELGSGIVIGNGSKSTLHDLHFELSVDDLPPGPVILDMVPPGDYFIGMARLTKSVLRCDQDLVDYTGFVDNRPTVSTSRPYEPLRITWVDSGQQTATPWSSQ